MKTMQELTEAIQSKGFPTEGLDEKQIRELGRVLKLELPPKERTVEITEYKGRRYLKTDGYVIGEEGGKPVTARGLFLEVRALEQARADIDAGLALLSEQS